MRPDKYNSFKDTSAQWLDYNTKKKSMHATPNFYEINLYEIEPWFSCLEKLGPDPRANLIQVEQKVKS